MIGRLAVVAAGIGAVAAAGAAAWVTRTSRRRKRRKGGGRRGGGGRAAAQRRGGGGKRSGQGHRAARGGAAAVNGARAGQARQATTPAPMPADAAASPGPPADGEDLQRVKGIGGVSAARLRAAGVTSVAQVAGWSEAAIDEMAATIKVSAERIRREDWAGQARRLAQAPGGEDAG